MRARTRALLAHRHFQRFIIAVILVNACTLGLETFPALVERHGTLLTVVDHVALYIFAAELIAKLYAERSAFWRDPWNIFDTLIVGIAFASTTGGLSVLRALRILRVLRLLSVVPSLRRVVSALLRAMPGMSSIVVLLSLVLYVAAVMATKLYGQAAPDRFGSLPTSLFTLYQTMTGDDWGNIAREVMSRHPSAWIFFTIFILVCTFVVLNLFLAVVVSAMDEESAEERAAMEDSSTAHTQQILDELTELRKEVAELRNASTQPVAANGNGSNTGPSGAGQGGTGSASGGRQGGSGGASGGGSNGRGKASGRGGSNRRGGSGKRAKSGGRGGRG
ncbi:voltage-gated sodium channel [Nonomuraea solani]|uniref:Voltage-gated sodium channel n=1 Tax=Nonomuraea solani TaxID=1144553 RepID=A0A1H6F1G0_9ACTN|nr:ion transporter [Nonomuraea solani]SEH03201.1 voltage-gated sodium channel [Nonomuraea solani]